MLIYTHLIYTSTLGELVSDIYIPLSHGFKEYAMQNSEKWTRVRDARSITLTIHRFAVASNF